MSNPLARRTGQLAAVGRVSLLLVIFLLVIAPPLWALTITEIHYNPHDNDSIEFVEIYNEGSIAQDLSGFFFTDGIDFVFPENYFLPAHGYIVLAVDPDALKKHYGIENVVGEAYSGRLNDEGERLRLANHTGSPVLEVRYDVLGSRWPAAVNGTGYTLSLRSPLLDCRRPENWVRSASIGGTPGSVNFLPPEIFNTEAVPSEQVWRYAKGWDPGAEAMSEFSDPPEAWRAVDFDDAAWAEGQAPIGFGGEGISTPLDDMRNNYFAFAMRRRFTLKAEPLDSAVSLVLHAGVDDAAVVWVNGVEVARLGMSGSPGEAVPTDQPSPVSNDLAEVQEIVVPKSAARAGENVLAVQIHNRTLRSSDAGFDTAILFRNIRTFDVPPAPTVVFNEISMSESSNERFVELYNLTTASIDLSGHWLTDSPTQKYSFPQGTEIPAQGFVFVGEGDLGFSLAQPTVSVYLYDPSGEAIVDAAAVRTVAEPSPTSRSRLPDGLGLWETSTILTPGAANEAEIEDGIVINEIHYNPLLVGGDGVPLLNSDKGEYVELLNKTEDRTISLEGFRFTDGIRFDFGAEHEIPPGGYLVVTRDAEFIRETYGLDETLVIGLPKDATETERDRFGALANGGERLRLEDAFGNVVDEVEFFDSGDWDPIADGGGSSLELIDPNADNASGFAWRASDESQKAPWVEIGYTALYPSLLGPGHLEPEMHIFLLDSGEVLLDDISLKSGDTEYIANGDFEENTAPWRLWGSHIHSFQTTAEGKVGGASLHLVATSGGNNRVDRVEVDTEPIPDGEINVHMWARWLEGSNAIHISGHNNAYGKTVWLPVPTQTGTPGTENSVRQALRAETGDDNFGPVVSKLRHDPPVPAPNEEVRFHANVIDDIDGIASVVVNYQRDQAEEIQQVTLLDDGMNDDGVPGDGHFAASVPGFSVIGVVNFWLEAADTPGAISVYPRGAPEEPRSLMVDAPFKSRVHRYRLVMTGKAALEFESRLFLSHDPLPGTFIFEENQIFYNVTYRYRAGGTPRPFRVRFPGDNKFRQTVKRFNISRSGRDHHEGMAYQLARKTSAPGVIVPHPASYEYAEVWFNDRSHGGTQTMSEVRVIDKIYAEYNWPNDPDGRAWKITPKFAYGDDGVARTDGRDFTKFRLYTNGPEPGTPSKENHRFYFNPRINKSLDAFGPLIELLTVVDPTTTAQPELEAQLEEIMNVEAFLRMFILRILQNDRDTLDIGNGHNSYFYYAPIEGRFYLVPWDLDTTFFNTDAPLEPPDRRVGLGRVLQSLKFRRLYATLMKEILDGPWAESYFQQYIDAVTETTGGLVQLVVEDLGIEGNLATFVPERRRVAEQFLRAGLDAEFAVTSESPAFTPSNTITIAGTAPLDVRQILVGVNDGDPVAADLRWNGNARSIPTEWELDVDGLVPGVNTIDLFGFSGAGDLVDSESVEAHSTAAGVEIGPFLRGDCDGNGVVGGSPTEAIVLLNFALLGAGPPGCLAACDAEANGSIGVTDAIRILRFAFLAIGEPDAPFPDCTMSTRATDETLGCEQPTDCD